MVVGAHSQLRFRQVERAGGRLDGGEISRPTPPGTHFGLELVAVDNGQCLGTNVVAEIFGSPSTFQGRYLSKPGVQLRGHHLELRIALGSMGRRERPR